MRPGAPTRISLISQVATDYVTYAADLEAGWTWPRLR